MKQFLLQSNRPAPIPGFAPSPLPVKPRSVLTVSSRNLNAGIPLSTVTGIPATDQKPEFSQTHILRRKVSKRIARRLGQIANAAKEIGTLPGPDESIHLIMAGSYHGWSAVGAILNLARPATIATLIVATLGFNTANARELLELIDNGQVGTVRFVASCYFEKSCKQEFRILKDGLTERSQQCAALRTHAKVIGAQMTDGRCFVIETSANLRSCRNIEQLTLCQSTELFDFHDEWISQAIQSCHGNESQQTL